MGAIESLVSRLAGKQLRSVEDRIRFYIGVNEKIIALGLFALLVGEKLDLQKYFGGVRILAPTTWVEHGLANVGGFLAAKGLSAMMAVFTTVWFFLYSRAVRDEVQIIANTFSRFNPPHDWESFAGKKFAPLMAFGIPLAFIAMAWFIDEIKFYCLILLVLNVLDLRGNSIIRQNLIRHFADPRYQPEESDLHQEFILRRRKVAERYWVFRPQLERIGILMIATVVALLCSLPDALFGVDVWIGVSYIILCSAITLNEMQMRVWRQERNAALLIIDDDEVAANRARSQDGDPESVPPASHDNAKAKKPRRRRSTKRVPS